MLRSRTPVSVDRVVALSLEKVLPMYIRCILAVVVILNT